MEALRIDPAAGPRAQAYAFYRAAARPRWGFTTRLHMGPLLAKLAEWRAECPQLTPLLAYHHALLRAAQAVPALRQRLLEAGGALEWPQLDASITLLRSDDSFACAYLPFAERLRDFVAPAVAAIAAARVPGTDWGLAGPHRGALYTTTLPWVDFTAFEHAHTAAFDEGTPRLAFGRFVGTGAAASMAFNLEVHHALVDGVHAGRYVQALQALLDEPDQLF